MALRFLRQIINSCGMISRSRAEQVCRRWVNGYRCNSLVIDFLSSCSPLQKLGYAHHRDHGGSLKYLCGEYCICREDCRKRKLRGAQRLLCNLVPMQHTFYQLQAASYNAIGDRRFMTGLSIWQVKLTGRGGSCTQQGGCLLSVKNT